MWVGNECNICFFEIMDINEIYVVSLSVYFYQNPKQPTPTLTVCQLVTERSGSLLKKTRSWVF